VTPSALLDAFRELAAGRPDLQVMQWMLGTEDALLPWLHSIAVSAEPRLKEHVAPLPPEDLRRIVAAHEPEIFLWTGFVDLTSILDLFAVHHRRPPSDGWDVLDFGCGCGRLTRFFEGAGPRWRARGSEVNPDHVTWCSASLPSVETRLNGVTPPLPFDAMSLDLVYSVSVFSHLSNRAAKAWMKDLARVVRPGGVVVMTTHGDNVLETIERSEPHQTMFRLTPDGAREVAERLHSEGLVFLGYDEDVLEMAKAGSDYGNTFVTPEHVAQEWLDGDFELCAHLPAGLRGWQDFVVLRRL